MWQWSHKHLSTTFQFHIRKTTRPAQPSNPSNNHTSHLYRTILREKGTEIQGFLDEFQCLNYNRNPVGTFKRYFKSSKKSLNDCDLAIYEHLRSLYELSLLLCHNRGALYPPKILMNVKQQCKDLKETIVRINERLAEPFVTAGTVTGDKCIKTCASRRQTNSFDLQRRSQVYPTRRMTCTSASGTI